MGQLLELCGNSAILVLGSVNSVVPENRFDPCHLLAYTDSSTPFPRVFCPKESRTSLQIIIFDRPSPTRMQYFSLNPISLALGVPNADGIDNAEEEARKTKLMKKLQLHTVIKHSPSLKELSLPTILNQINCSFELAELIKRNVRLRGTRQKRSLSVGEMVVESATTLWDYIVAAGWHLLTAWVYPVLTRVFVIMLVGHRVIAEVVLSILEWRPRPESAALKDISATAQQVDIRLQQFCYWPIQYLTLRKRKDDWESITDRHPDYIRFYNSLWLVANDVIIGIALGSYIIDNAGYVAYQINNILSGWTVEGLRDMISWLMDWPAGLKLNNELAVFLGDLFLWVIDYWRGNDSLCVGSAFGADLSRRMREQSPTLFAPCYILHRILKLCWCYNAHCFIFGPSIPSDGAHILFLYRIGPHISLATNHHRLFVPFVPGQKA